MLAIVVPGFTDKNTEHIYKNLIKCTHTRRENFWRTQYFQLAMKEEEQLNVWHKVERLKLKIFVSAEIHTVFINTRKFIQMWQQ